MSRVNPVIIICGAPGVGKSTLARELMSHWGRGATVEVDELRCMINQIDWNSHQQHFDGIRAAVTVCKSYRQADYWPVALVDTFGFGSIDIAKEALGDLSMFVISLTSSNAAIRWRLFRRVGGYRDWRSALKFNAHIRQLASAHDLSFDTSRQSLQEIAKAIVRELERRN